MTRIVAEARAGVGHITLARPEKRNALDEVMAAELGAALRLFGGDPAVRVVLLDAQGPDFCAGADLEALEQMIDAGGAVHEKDARTLGAVFTLIRHLERPVVAAVRGRALAGGTGLATACDIVLAHEDAQFGYPEIRIGFVPAMVMTMLRRSVGEKRAFDLVATGSLVGAAEAQALGLVSRVIPAADFDAEVDRVVTALATAPPGALRLTKRLFYELDGLGFDAGIARGVATNVVARSTSDFREGLRRFIGRQTKKP
ncbi:MAG TPA: enoyl-CoA hydratase-related protein [Gemmatimonadaceae bacterium]|nr:enoyl-CoA hydratase-related protein [Gemmatimonadaceae bacterium]